MTSHQACPSLSRRTFAKVALAGGGALALGGALSGCSQPTNSENGTEEGDAQGETQAQVIVTMPISAEPAAGFDPFVSWGCGEHVHEPLIQSTLQSTAISSRTRKKPPTTRLSLRIRPKNLRIKTPFPSNKFLSIYHDTPIAAESQSTAVLQKSAAGSRLFPWGCGMITID